MSDIRKAEIDDLEAISQLAYKIWPSAYQEILGKAQLNYMLDKIYSLHSLEHQFLILKHQFIMVIEDDRPIGFASFSAHADPEVYHLNKLYVVPDEQGKNIGKQILEYVICEIKNAGANSLQLNVNRFNKALHFYQKQGFKIIREEDIDIGSGYFMNDYVMEKKI
ncbi:MAG TPA: GNAT family N-acetyltransferase [Hanamia sp.]|jgi:GNAT superfamily N-acetyltransferase|nr:GNAT family N-acetyltransferase [Hanamia sp.]